MSSTCYLNCHLYCRMSISPRDLFVMVRCVLGIVNQHVRSLHKRQKFGRTTCIPFYIGCIDHTTTGVFDAVEQCPVAGMALCEFCCHTDLHFSSFCRLPLIHSWLDTPTLPPDTL